MRSPAGNPLQAEMRRDRRTFTDRMLRCPKVTLDTNCIIALEKEEPAADSIRSLKIAHQAERIELRVVAISAVEWQKSWRKLGQPPLSQFTEKLDRAGLNGVVILRPMAYIELCYIDWGLICDDGMIAKERRIHEIIAPSIEFDYDRYCEKRHIKRQSGTVDRKWLNAKCDTQMMWSHIHHKGDVFVTNDRDFLKPSRKELLEDLGAGMILNPQAIAATLDKS